MIRIISSNDIVFYARLLISLLAKSQEPWPSIHTEEGMRANLLGARYLPKSMRGTCS